LPEENRAIINMISNPKGKNNGVIIIPTARSKNIRKNITF